MLRNSDCLITGYYVSHGDLVGPFSGILYGFANTMSQATGIIIPLLIAALAPEVKNLVLEALSMKHASLETWLGYVIMAISSVFI